MTPSFGAVKGIVHAPSAKPVPCNLIDVYPFIMECVGEDGMADDGQGGISIARLARGERPARTVLSEYHGMGPLLQAKSNDSKTSPADCTNHIVPMRPVCLLSQNIPKF
jgi:hypothetical protein